MNIKCHKCRAFRFYHETNGICCCDGRVPTNDLDPLPPDNYLFKLLTLNDDDSIHFRKLIGKYNCLFQMCSFGLNVDYVVQPTFKIQGRLYHRIGSLRPPDDHSPGFLQLYFIENMHQQAEMRNNILPGAHLRPHIIQNLQNMLHEINELVRLLKSADQMQQHLNQNNLENTTSNISRSSAKKVVICADKKPSREHERKFNAPTTSEVGLILVGEDFPSRNIVIQDKEDRLQFINEWNSISIGFSEG
jgi:hypothetical protein